MLLLLKRTKIGLIPISDESAKAVSKIKLEDEIYMEWKPRRNYRFHKKFYSMINLIFPNQEEFRSLDEIVIECKLDAGYYDIHVRQNGEKIKIPKSISFFSMDQLQFEEFYSCAIDTCLRIVPMGKEELENAILRYC